jgi:hypothetical protein
MVGRILVAVASTGASALVVSGLPEPVPLDRSLPFVVILIAILAWTAGRFESLVHAALPILVFLAMVPVERPRLLSYGVILGFAGVVAGAGLMRTECSDTQSLLRRVAFVLVITVLLRAVPAASEMLAATTLLLIGVAALTVLFHGRQDSWHALPLIIAAGLVTPLVPLRASLFPLLLAILILSVRSNSLTALACAAVLAVVAGKWAMLLVAIGALPVLILSIQARNVLTGRPMLAIPPIARSWPVAVRFFSFAPSLALDVFAAGRGVAIAAMLILALSVALRPALATLYLVAAALLVLPAQASPTRQRLAIVSAWFAAFWLVLFSWGGALPPAFPLPAPLLTVMGLSALVAVPLFIRPNWLAGAITAAFFLALLGFRPSMDQEFQPIDQALRPGESLVISPQRGVTKLSLVMSGANVSALPPGANLGLVELVDEAGRGYRRDITLGEVADWGAFRPGHFFVTQNAVPDEVPRIAGFGSSAFLAGLSRISLQLQGSISTLRVTVSDSLPQNAVLQLHRLEFPPQ